jgi:hypothetical protein
MRGRKPSGPESVEQLQGSEQAKERLVVVLQTLAGHCRMGAACQQLHVGKTRFHQLRQAALQAALASLEPKPIGRPRQAEAVVSGAEMAALTQRVLELEVEARTAQVGEEIALTLPHRGRDRAAADEDAPEKKRARGRGQRGGVPGGAPESPGSLV